jgi:hypothetical protein
MRDREKCACGAFGTIFLRKPGNVGGVGMWGGSVSVSGMGVGGWNGSRGHDNRSKVKGARQKE